MGTSERGHIGPESYPETTDIPEPEGLMGAPVVDRDGTAIGVVEDVYVDSEGAYVRYVAIVAEGGDRRRLMPIDEMSRHEEGVRAPYLADDLRDSPELGRDDPLTPEHEENLYRHYGRTGYWEEVRARQRTPAAIPEIARAEGEAGEDLAARQTAPAPTPEIAGAEVEDAIERGRDPRGVRVKRWGV